MNGPATAIERYDAAPCGLLVADLNGDILDANATLCRWLFCECSELRGRKLQDLLTVGGRMFFQTHLAPLLRMQGSVAEVKLELRRSDASTIPVMVNLAQQTAADGTSFLHAAIFVAEDRHRYERELLMRRQQAEELAAQHERDQQALLVARAQAEDRAVLAEQMMGIVSHDLRNPLSVIKMSATLLSMSSPDGKHAPVLARIHRAVDRAERLISDLLDLSQARIGGGLRVRPRQVDVHDVAADVVNELSPAYPERKILHVRDGGGEWTADPDRVAQAIGNLVSNAATYGDPAHPIVITSTAGAKLFQLRVHNRGPAIPAALMQSLFEPMVRGEEQGAQRSVGLGLFIVREIARAHNGNVRVESTDADGTTFVIELGRTVAAE